jgi:hypothetical protein
MSMLSTDQVNAARLVPIQSLCGELRLRRSGCELVGACPRCGGTDRFAVHLRKGLFNCRGCNARGDVIALTQHIYGVGFAKAVQMLAGPLRALKAPAVAPAAGKREPNANLGSALAIWDESDPWARSPVEFYLGLRRVVLPPGCTCIRLHPHCPFGKDGNSSTIYTPAMVALVTSILDNKPLGIHRTALDRQGNGVEVGGLKRRTLGATAGGAIKLTPDDEVSIALGAGEGIESALSLRRLPEWLDGPVWSLLNKKGIADLPVLASIETLAVAVDADADGAGEQAARTVGQRWREAGREVLLFIPSQNGEDLNDIARRRIA